MSNNLPRLLAELSEISPQVCQSFETDAQYYQIKMYIFAFNQMGGIRAFYHDGDDKGIMVSGQAAHDWLQGALMRVIKSKDWGYKIQSPASTELTFAKVYFLPDGIFSSDGDNATEALLTALVQAIKGE